MAKNYETGSAKNLANFDELIRNVKSFGDLYMPPVPLITMPNLEIKAQMVRNTLDFINRADAAYNIALAAKEEEFKPLKKLFTRVLNILKIMSLPQSLIDEATSLNRKMQGKRATAKLTNTELNTLRLDGVEKKQISSSQQSVDNLIETFGKLIELLLSIGNYAPNEIELQLPFLTNQHSQLKLKNKETDDENVALNNARAARDLEMYAPQTGMVDVALAVKNYVKAAFNANSTQYKQISGIAIKTIK